MHVLLRALWLPAAHTLYERRQLDLCLGRAAPVTPHHGATGSSFGAVAGVVVAAVVATLVPATVATTIAVTPPPPSPPPTGQKSVTKLEEILY